MKPVNYLSAFRREVSGEGGGTVFTELSKKLFTLIKLEKQAGSQAARQAGRRLVRNTGHCVPFTTAILVLSFCQFNVR
jgi:hypothetical protein